MARESSWRASPSPSSSSSPEAISSIVPLEESLPLSSEISAAQGSMAESPTILSPKEPNDKKKSSLVEFEQRMERSPRGEGSSKNFMEDAEVDYKKVSEAERPYCAERRSGIAERTAERHLGAFKRNGGLDQIYIGGSELVHNAQGFMHEHLLTKIVDACSLGPGSARKALVIAEKISCKEWIAIVDFHGTQQSLETQDVEKTAIKVLWTHPLPEIGSKVAACADGDVLVIASGVRRYVLHRNPVDGTFPMSTIAFPDYVPLPLAQLNTFRLALGEHSPEVRLAKWLLAMEEHGMPSKCQSTLSHEEASQPENSITVCIKNPFCGNPIYITCLAQITIADLRQKCARAEGLPEHMLRLSLESDESDLADDLIIADLCMPESSRYSEAQSEQCKTARNRSRSSLSQNHDDNFENLHSRVERVMDDHCSHSNRHEDDLDTRSVSCSPKDDDDSVSHGVASLDEDTCAQIRPPVINIFVDAKVRTAGLSFNILRTRIEALCSSLQNDQQRSHAPPNPSWAQLPLSIEGLDSPRARTEYASLLASADYLASPALAPLARIGEYVRTRWMSSQLTHSETRMPDIGSCDDSHEESISAQDMDQASEARQIDETLPQYMLQTEEATSPTLVSAETILLRCGAFREDTFWKEDLQKHIGCLRSHRKYFAARPFYAKTKRFDEYDPRPEMSLLVCGNDCCMHGRQANVQTWGSKEAKQGNLIHSRFTSPRTKRPPNALRSSDLWTKNHQLSKWCMLEELIPASVTRNAMCSHPAYRSTSSPCHLLVSADDKESPLFLQLNQTGTIELFCAEYGVCRLASANLPSDGKILDLKLAMTPFQPRRCRSTTAHYSPGEHANVLVSGQGASAAATKESSNISRSKHSKDPYHHLYDQFLDSAIWSDLVDNEQSAQLSNKALRSMLSRATLYFTIATPSKIVVIAYVFRKQGLVQFWSKSFSHSEVLATQTDLSKGLLWVLLRSPKSNGFVLQRYSLGSNESAVSSKTILTDLIGSSDNEEFVSNIHILCSSTTVLIQDKRSGKIWIFDAGTLETQRSDLILPGPNLVRSLSDGPDPFLFVFEKRDDSLQTYICQMSSVHSQTLSADARNAILFSARLGQVLSHRIHLLSPNLRIANVTSDSMNLPIVTTLVIDHFMQNQATLELEYPFDTLVGQFNCEIFFPVHGSISAYKSFNPRAHCHVTLFFLDHNDHVVSTYGKTLIAQREVFLKESRRGTCDGHVSSLATASQTMCTAESKASSGASPMGIDSAKTSTKASASSSSRIETISSHTTKNVANVASGGIGAGATMRTSASRCIDDGKGINSSSASIVNNRSSGLWVPGSSVQSFYGNLQEYSEEIWKRGNLNNLATNDSSPADVNVLKQHPRQSESNGNDTKSDDVLRLERDSGQWNLQTLPLNVSKVVVSVRILQLDEGLDLSSADDPRESTCSATPPPLVLQVSSTGRQSTDGRFPSNIPKDNITKFVDDLCESQSESAVRLLRSLLPIYMDVIWKSLNKTKSRVIRLFHEGVLQADLSHSIATYAFLHDLLASNKNHSDTWTDIVLGCMKDMVNLPMLSAPSIRMFFSIFTEFYEPRLPNVESNLKMLLKILRDYGEQLISFENKDSQAVFMGLIRRHFKSHQAVFTPMAFELESVFETPQSLQRREELQREVSLLHGGPYQGVSVSKVSLLTTRFLESNIQNPDVALLDGGERNSCRVVGKLTDSLIALQRASLTVEWERYMKSAALSSMNPPLKLSTAVPPALNKDPTLSTSNSMILSAAGIGRSVHATWDCDTPSGKKQNVALAIGLGDPFDTSKPVFLQAVQVTLRIMRGTHRRQVDDYISTSPIGSLSLITFDNEVTARQAARSKSIDMRWLKTHGNVICERLSLAKWSSDAPPSLVKSSRTLFVLPSVCAKGNFLVAVVNFTDLHGLGSYALCVSATGVEAETPSEQSIRLMERTCSALAEKWTMCSNVMKKFLLSHAEVWESERHPSEDEHNFFQELYTIMAALQAGQTMVSRKLMTIQGCLPVSDHIARLKLCSKLLARSLETFLEEGKSKAHEPDIQNHLIALSRTFGLYCTSRSLRKSFLHALVHVANHVPNLVVKIIRNEIDLNPDVLSWINKADFRFLGDLLREMNSTSNFLPDTVTSLLRLAHECLRKSEAYYHVAHATVNLLTTRSTTMFSLSNPADREQPRRTHSRGGSGLDTCVPDALALLCEAQQLASLVSNGLLRDIYVLSFHIIQQLSVRLGDTQFASAMSDEAVWPMVQSLLVVNNDELISSDSLKRTCAETLMDRICQADEEAWAPLQVNITNLINGSSSDDLIPSMLPLIRWAEIGDTLYVETLRGLLNLTFSIRDSKIWTDLANVLCTVSVDKLRAIPSEEIMDAVRIRLSSGSGEPSVTMNLVRKVLEAFSGAEELHDDYCYIVVGLANLAISTEPLILQELVPCLHHEIMTTFSQVKISRRVSLSIANFLCHGMGRLLDFRKAELSFEKALAKAADLTAATAQVDAKTAQSNILDHLHNSKSKSGPMETPQVSAKGETDILPDFLTPPSGVSVLQWTVPASEGNAHEASPYHVEPQKSTLKSPPLQTATGKKFAQASDKDSKTDHAIAQATAEVERMAQEVALTQWSDELMIDFLLLSIFVLDTPALRSEMRRVDFCNMVCSCASFEENIIVTHNKLTSQSKWFADEEKWILTSFLARQYKEEANLARLKEVICSSQIGFWLTLRAVIYHLGSLDVGVTLKACLRSAVDLGIECKSAVSESMLLLMETQPQALQKFVEIGGAEILSRYIRGDSGARTPMAVNRNLVIPTLPNSEALKERSDTLLVSLQHMFARDAGKDFPSFIIDPSFLTRTNKDGQNETGDAFQSLATACSPIENIRVEKSQAQSSVSYYFFSALEKVLSSRFRESYTFSAQCRFENTTEVSFVLDLRQVYRLADIELTFETSLKTSRGVSLVPASIRIEAGLTASELRCCGLKNGTEHSLAHAQNLLLRRCTYCFPVREHTSPVMARYVRVILAKPDTEKQTSTVVIKRISITGQLLCRSIGMSMEDLYFQDVRASRQILLPIVECVATLLSNVSICPAELRSSLQASLVTWACREASPQARALLKKSGFWSLEEASSQALLVESWMDAIVQRQNFMDPGADASTSMLFKMQDVRDRSQKNILHVLEEAKLDASRVCACAWTLGVLLEVSSLSVTLGVAVRALDDIASFSWDKNVSSLLVASEKLKVIAEILFLKLKHNADGKTSIDELHSAILLQFSEKIVQGLRHLRTLFKTIGVDFRSILAPVVNRGRVGLVRLTCQAVALWPVVLDNIMELAPELYDLSSLSERDKSIQSADCKVLKLAEGNLDIPCLGLSVELAALLAVSAGSSGYTWSTYILQRLMDMPKMPHRGLKCIAILAEAGHEEIQIKIMDYLDKLIDIARSDSKVEIIARILAALFGKGSQSEQILNMLCQNLSKNKTLVDNSCNKHASDRHLVMLLIRMLSSSGTSRICIWPGKGSNGAEHMQLSALANSWDHPNKVKSSPLQLLQARMLRSKSRSYAEVFGFDASRCSSELVISKDSSTMSVTPSILAQTDLTAFCSKSMTRGHVFEWKYKLDLDVDASFSIGVSTKNDDLKLGSTRSTVWGIRRDGRKWHNSKKISYCPRYCSPVEPASSVTVRLDLEQGELGFYINDIWQGVAYAGLPLDPSYYAFVSLFCDGGYASQSIHVQGLGSSSSSFGSSLERTPLHLLLAWEWHYSLQSSAGSDLMQNDSSTASHGRKRNVLEHSSKRTRRTSSVLAQLRSQHHDNGTGVVDNMESEFDLGDLASLRLSSVVLEGSKGSCESKREPPVLEKPLPIAVPGSSNDDGYVWALRPFPVACIARDLDPDTIRALIACELNIVHEPSKPRHRSLLGRVLVEKVRSVPSEAKFQPEDLGLMECSFVDTHERFVEQDWFHCKTCGLRGSNGCCAICAIVCHHGHDVRYHGRSKFYCDCGCSSKCKSLSDSRLSLLSTIAQGRARMRDIGVSWEYSLNDEASADALEMTRFHSPGLSTANFKAILGYDSSIFSTLLLKLEEDLLDHYSKPNVRITPLQLTSGETRSKSKLGEWPRFLCLARALSMIPGYVKAFGASENCMIMLSALLASSFAKIQPGSKAVALCHQDPGKPWVESLAVMESFSPEDVIHSGVLEFLLLRLGDLHGEQPVEGRVEALMARFDPRYVQVQAVLESKLPTAVETEAEEERWTLSKSLTNLTGSEGQFTTKFEKGQEIEIQYDDATSDWLIGVIVSTHFDGTCDVDVPDMGEIAFDVPISRIRRKTGEVAGSDQDVGLEKSAQDRKARKEIENPLWRPSYGVGDEDQSRADQDREEERAKKKQAIKQTLEIIVCVIEHAKDATSSKLTSILRESCLPLIMHDYLFGNSLKSLLEDAAVIVLLLRIASHILLHPGFGELSMYAAEGRWPIYRLARSLHGDFLEELQDAIQEEDDDGAEKGDEDEKEKDCEEGQPKASGNNTTNKYALPQNKASKFAKLVAGGATANRTPGDLSVGLGHIDEDTESARMLLETLHTMDNFFHSKNEDTNEEDFVNPSSEITTGYVDPCSTTGENEGNSIGSDSTQLSRADAGTADIQKPADSQMLENGKGVKSQATNSTPTTPDGVYVDAVKKLIFGNTNFDAPGGAQARARASSLSNEQAGLGDLVHFYRKEVSQESHNKPPRGRAVRLNRELRSLRNLLPVHLGSTIAVRVDERRPFIMQAVIFGPEGTPYDSGCFVFDIYMPPEYPNCPPNIRLMTTGGGTVRFNPNLYVNGKVCLSLLGTWRGGATGNETWTKKSSLLQVLVSIQSAILGSEYPYFNEPGVESRWGTAQGDLQKRVSENGGYERLRVATLRYAIIEQIRYPPANFADLIRTHFRLKQDHILAVADSWIENAKLSDTRGHLSALETLRSDLAECLASLDSSRPSAQSDDDIVKTAAEDETGCHSHMDTFSASKASSLQAEINEKYSGDVKDSVEGTTSSDVLKDQLPSP